MRFLLIFISCYIVYPIQAQWDVVPEAAMVKKNRIKKITKVPGDPKAPVVTFNFDREGRLLYAEQKDRSGAIVLNTIYHYDSLGRIRAEVAKVEESYVDVKPIVFGSGAIASETRTDYLYHPDGKLWMKITVDTNGMVDKQVSYTYSDEREESTKYFAEGKLIRTIVLYTDLSGRPSKMVTSTVNEGEEWTDITGTYSYDKKKQKRRRALATYTNDAGCTAEVRYTFNRRKMLEEKSGTGCIAPDSFILKYERY